MKKFCSTSPAFEVFQQ